MYNSIDFASALYLNHEQKLAVSAISRQLRYLLRWYEHIDPAKATAIRGHVYLLESFLPVCGGAGSIRINARDIGRLRINVDPGMVSLDVGPHNPVFCKPVEDHTVFAGIYPKVKEDNAEGIALALRILRFVNLRYQRYGEIPDIEACWTQHPELVPSPEWVALREAALEAGHEPPRAAHWMIELE